MKSSVLISLVLMTLILPMLLIFVATADKFCRCQCYPILTKFFPPIQRPEFQYEKKHESERDVEEQCDN